MAALQQYEPRIRETKSIQAELCRFFFAEFFESEFITVPGQLKVLLVGLLAILLSLGAPFAQAYYHKYRLLNTLDDPAPFHSAVLADVLFLVTGTMLVAALATVLQWPALFPSRRDYLALASLPIRSSQIFVAKLGALVGFILLVIAAVAVPASGLPGLMRGRHGGSMAGHVPGIFIACMAGGLFVFFMLVALQGLLLNLLPSRLSERISPTIQATLLLGLLLSLPGVILTAGLNNQMGQRPDWMFWAPPLWFLGLEQTIAGTQDPVAFRLAGWGAAGVGIAAAAVILAYVWSYQRHRALVLEGVAGRRREPWGLWATLEATVLPNPRTQAVFSFILKTLARSPQHRLILTGFVGIALAAVAESLAGYALSSFRGESASVVPVQVAVAGPLVLTLFTLAGFRFLFRLPAELKANWLLRTTEPGHGPELLAATDRFLLYAGVAPLMALSVVFEIYLLGSRMGLVAALLIAAVGPLLVEVLLFTFGRIPFTSSYLPGRRPLIETLLLYGVGFVVYVSLQSAVIAWCLTSPVGALVFAGTAAVVRRKLRVERLDTLCLGRLDFEEIQEPTVQVIGIEGD